MTEHPFEFQTWDAYLEDLKHQKIPWQLGPDGTEHPQYPTELLNLINEFTHSDYFDQNFKRTLYQRGFNKMITEDDLRALASETDTDFFTLRAVVSMLMHNEHYFEGLWAAMVNNGLLQTFLRQIHAKTPADFPIW